MVRALALTASVAGGGFGIDASLPPVILSRAGNAISIPVGTNIRAGIEFKATTERKAMDLHIIEMDAGSWVIVENSGVR